MNFQIHTSNSWTFRVTALTRWLTVIINTTLHPWMNNYMLCFNDNLCLNSPLHRAAHNAAHWPLVACSQWLLNEKTRGKFFRPGRLWFQCVVWNEDVVIMFLLRHPTNSSKSVFFYILCKFPVKVDDVNSFCLHGFTAKALHALVSADPQTTLHHQIRKVSVGDGGFPPLHTTRGERRSKVGRDSDQSFQIVQGGAACERMRPTLLHFFHFCKARWDRWFWSMFMLIVLQPYNVCKGKSSQVWLDLH